MDKAGKLYTTDVLMHNVKQNRKGVYVLKKKLFIPQASFNRPLFAMEDTKFTEKIK